jgi:transposase
MKSKTNTQRTARKQSTSGLPRRSSASTKASSLGKGQRAETNRRAAAVLEVLAGVRTPSEAAQALGLSVNYYYVLERKALAGLLAACQPQPKGPPQPSGEQQLARLKQELEKCRQECLRQSALVRAAERAIGLSALSPPTRREKEGKVADGKTPRRRRRPTVRALRAAQTLRKNSSLEEVPAGVEPLSDGRVNSTTCVAIDKESGDGTQGPQAARSGTC